MKSDYYERQERRREIYAERAQRARAEAAALEKQNEPLRKCHAFMTQPGRIPERDRFFRRSERAHKLTRKAAYYDGKAETMGRSGISSDAPDALEQLKEKVANLETAQDMMKRANQIIRRKPKNEITDEKRAALAEVVGQCQVGAVLAPDFGGRIGFADYKLKNNNANIRRIKERIAQLEAAESAETVEYERAGVKVVESVEDNRLQLFFDGKPGADVRQTLKRNGFRWARSLGCWQRHLNNGARFAAEQVLKSLEQEGAQ